MKGERIKVNLERKAKPDPARPLRTCGEVRLLQVPREAIEEFLSRLSPSKLCRTLWMGEIHT